MNEKQKQLIWEAACKATLQDFSKTFLCNMSRAEKESDKDVFQAIGETIQNFPIPEYTQQTQY